MALNIRDKPVDRLATQPATADRMTKTPAAMLALQEHILAKPETGLPADKDFFDALNSES